MARKLKQTIAAKRRRRLAQIRKQKRCKCGAFLGSGQYRGGLYLPGDMRKCVRCRRVTVPKPGETIHLKKVQGDVEMSAGVAAEIERGYLPRAFVEGAYRDAMLPAAGADPWAHRSKGMSCSTCMWFVRKGTGKLGRCRRHAPTMSGYPAVFETDWCGDHKVDETKL